MKLPAFNNNFPLYLFIILSVKKVFSILSVMAVLMAALHLSVAIHYCQGEFAAAKLSFKAEPAVCGMENGSYRCFPRGEYTSPCCEDHISQCNTDSRYIPSIYPGKKAFRNISTIYKSGIPGLTIPALTYIADNIGSRPPGGQSDIVTHVSLPEICVFRK